MNRKILVFVNQAGEKQRVYFRNGICRNPQTLELVMANREAYSWDKIKTTGNTEPMQHMKFKAQKHYGNVVIPAQFAGQQEPPKMAPKEVILDADGKALPPKRGKKSSITPEIIESMKKLAEEGKTIKQAETLLGLSYPTIFQNAKKEGIVFAKGKKGRQAKAVNLVGLDPDLMNKIKQCAREGKSLAQTSRQLEIPYPMLVKLAKKDSLVFVKGKKGFQKKNLDNTPAPVVE